MLFPKIESLNKPPLVGKKFPRRWKPTLGQELHAYLAVLVHTGLHIESSIEDYWLKTLAMERFTTFGTTSEQIDGSYFYCTEPRSEDDCKVGPCWQEHIDQLNIKK